LAEESEAGGGTPPDQARSKRELRPETAAEFVEAAGYAIKGGHPKVALQCLNKALGLEPENALAHAHLGIVFKSVGKIQLAEKAYLRALELNPAHIETLNNFGNLLASGNRFEEAKGYLQKAVELQPDFPQAHNTLGIAYLKLNEVKKAMHHLGEALRIQPEFVTALQNLGQAHLFLNQVDEAEEYFLKAKEKAGEIAEIDINLARVYMAKSELKKAVDLVLPYARRDGEKKELPMALVIIGQVHERQENYKKAKGAMERALELGFRSSGMLAHLGVIQVQQLNEYDKGVERLEEALEKDNRNLEAKCALAGAYTILGKLDLAEARLMEVLEVNPEHAHAYRQLAHIKKADEENAPSVEDMLKRIEDPEIPKPQKIELSYGLADAYDQLGEHDKAFPYLKTANDMDAENHPFDMEKPRKAIKALKSIFTKEFFEERKEWGLQTDVPVFIVGMPRSGTTLTEQILASHPQVYGAGELKDIGEMKSVMRHEFKHPKAFPFCSADLTTEQIDSLAERHLAHLRSMDPDAIRITDKMPFNYYALGLIHLLYPKAKLIHCMRNALDNCLSCYFLRFVDKMSFSTNMEQLGEIYRLHTEIMDHWKEVIPAPILEMQYEETVADQKAQTRRILDFCGLNWDDACMEFHKNDRPVKTASNWQVRQPIYSTSDGRWKNYRDHLGPLAESLGIDLSSLD
jgi:tetratricopeptide (TPR) repeat protein